MDNCSSCLLLKEAQKVAKGDELDKPTYCRACYQRVRVKLEQLEAENKQLRKLLADELDVGQGDRVQIEAWIEQALVGREE